LTSRNQRISKRYASAQTALLIFFAAVVSFSPKTYLFTSSPAVLAGSILCATGIVIILLGLMSLRGTVQISPEPKAGRQLVDTGVYKCLRHPIYTGIIFSVVGLFLRQPSIWVAAAAVIVIGFLWVKVRFEERLLETTYPGYAAYRRRSWGLFPGLRF
jgi:protein-S-isoprenylcysteine O-methyltransferase Ste14